MTLKPWVIGYTAGPAHDAEPQANAKPLWE